MRLVFETGKHSRPAEAKEELTFNQLLERIAANSQVSSGVSVTPYNAMRCTTVQGIVRALTNAIGSYPPSVVIKKRGANGYELEEKPEHNITRLLQRPNAVHTSTEFFRMVTQHIALHGNFYALKVQGKAGPIGALRPIEDPARVSVEDIDWRSGVRWRVQFDEGERIVPQSNMVHITCGLLADDGVTGKSPIVEAKEAIGICIAAERLIAQLYGNNDVPTLALIGGMFRSEEDYRLWVDKFKEARGQVSDGRGGTLLLPEGMDVKEMSFKPVDAQLLEMRKFQRIEIAQVYGVPPHKLADLERATFSNIEEQSLEFVRDVAAPWVKLIVQAITRDCLTEQDQRAGAMVRLDMEAATEGKLKERLEAYGKAHDVGAMNPNEIRQKIGLNPRKDPGGEAYATPLNMRTSNERTTDDSDSEESRRQDADSNGVESDDDPI